MKAETVNVEGKDWVIVREHEPYADLGMARLLVVRKKGGSIRRYLTIYTDGTFYLNERGVALGDEFFNQ